MALDTSILGSEGEPIEREWSVDDTLLYALGVGAGQADQCQELAFTTENTADVTLQALPTMASLLSSGPWPNLGDIDMRKFLHVRETLELHSPWPVSGRLRTSARVADIFDKGNAAILVVESSSFDVETGAPLATTRRSVFLGGEGGFGGDRGPKETWEAPERAPDAQIECHTRPEQALLYRLTGDRVRLHSDPSFAASAGFEKPILHGMCTFGYAARTLINALCGGDATRIASIDARFASPVIPGDVLDVQLWNLGDAAIFRVLVGDRVVLDRGTAQFR
jgi:acyl dehydratase